MHSGGSFFSCGDKARLLYGQGQHGLCNEFQASLVYINSVSKNRKRELIGIRREKNELLYVLVMQLLRDRFKKAGIPAGGNF